MMAARATARQFAAAHPEADETILDPGAAQELGEQVFGGLLAGTSCPARRSLARALPGHWPLDHEADDSRRGGRLSPPHPGHRENAAGRGAGPARRAGGLVTGRRRVPAVAVAG